MNGYVVESFADAPMRVRAWFESEDDAREYGRRFGDSVRIYAGEILAGDAVADLKRDTIGLTAQLRFAQRDLDNARAEAESARLDADDAHRELVALRKVAA